MSEFDDCVKRGKLVLFLPAKKMVQKELSVAQDDLKSSQESIKYKNYKWATIQAYYAMFHAARSLLYYKGYREKSHYCLILAMKHFYVADGKLRMSLLDSLQMAKALRENADYDNTYDLDSAQALIAQAKEFVDIAQKLCG